MQVHVKRWSVVIAEEDLHISEAPPAQVILWTKKCLVLVFFLPVCVLYFRRKCHQDVSLLWFNAFSKFIVFLRSALPDFWKPRCTNKNGCKSYSIGLCLNRFCVHAFLWYCLSKCVVILLSMRFHKHVSMEVCYVCVRIFVFIFWKGSVWVDLLWRYEGVKVKDNMLVINVSADGGKRSTSR